MKPKAKSGSAEMPLGAMLTLWSLALVVFCGWRFWLYRTYEEAPMGPGALLMAGLLACLAWLMVEPPRISRGQLLRLGGVVAGLLLLFSGEQFLWLRTGDKALYFWPGYALLGLGALLLAGLSWGEDALAGEALDIKWEWIILAALLVLGAALRIYRLGEAPSTWWYDELNLARAAQDHVLEGGELPVYVAENVENPGMYVWIAGLVFKIFGVGINQLRWLAAFFGWLSLLPFYFLARRMLGVAWGLAALALFCGMRWTLIPQHIGFMSGFAIFFTLCAVYFYWRALGTKTVLDFGLAGLCLGFTLHTYTPTRLVIPMLGLFSIWHWRLLKGTTWRAWLALGCGFLLVAGPMLVYILEHWGSYSLRARQVSIMNDIHAHGWGELWVSFTKHIQSFNFRGDFNARHNISFWPQLDFVSGGLFAAALVFAHLRAFKDPRAFLFSLWFWIMLSAGILSMTVEAPQAHRSILVAPVCALAIAWFLAALSRRASAAFESGPPNALLAALVLCLAAVPLFNGYELFKFWPDDAATWRSFSPESTLAARRAAASPADWEVYLSPLKDEYQFHGYERDQFVRFTLKQQKRSFYQMQLSQGLIGHPAGVLAIWGDSDKAMSEAMARDFPDIKIEEAKDPFEARNDYLAAEIPYARIPELKKAKTKAPFFFRP